MKKLMISVITALAFGLGGCGGSDGQQGAQVPGASQNLVRRSETFVIRDCLLTSSSSEYYDGVLVLSGLNASLSYTFYEDENCRLVNEEPTERDGTLTEVVTLANGLEASVLSSEFADPVYLVFQEDMVLVFLEQDATDFLVFSK